MANTKYWFDNLNTKRDGGPRRTHPFFFTTDVEYKEDSIMSQYNLCVICEKVKANPLHVNKKHQMSWNEYQRLSVDPEFLKEVATHRKLREEKAVEEYRSSRILTYKWFTKTRSLTGIMKRYLHHAKSAKAAFKGSVFDMSEFDGQTEAIVGTVELAEAMTKNGWECLTKKGGHDGSPKQYIMRKVD